MHRWVATFWHPSQSGLWYTQIIQFQSLEGPRLKATVLDGVRSHFCKMKGIFLAWNKIVSLIFITSCQHYTVEKAEAFLTYAVHAAQSRESSSCHLLDAILMDPQLNQRGRQVLRDSGQQILGEVEFLHVLQRHKCSGVDFGNEVIPQRQTLMKKTKAQWWRGKIQHLISKLQTLVRYKM